jgi:hypothetical protein
MASARPKERVDGVADPRRVPGGQQVDQRPAEDGEHQRPLAPRLRGVRIARRIYETFGFRLESENRHVSFGQDLVGQNWSLDL